MANYILTDERAWEEIERNYPWLRAEYLIDCEEHIWYKFEGYSEELDEDVNITVSICPDDGEISVDIEPPF